ncbi:MAG: rhodanese-like domain-containing protein [Actinomycetota bacterium]
MTTRRILSAALLAVLLLVGCGTSASSSPAASATTAVTPAEGKQLIDSMGASLTVIDVRTPAEYAAGHLANALNLDLEGGMFSKGIATLTKGAAYMVYCHSGRRSAIAASTMAAAGFTKVYDLGGVAAWQAAGLPLVTG